MAIYRVPIREITYGAMFIEADSREHAKQMVIDGEYNGTDDYQWYESESQFDADNLEEVKQ
jgi:DNA-dependent RNA polymerase auxiliary subunit epsilon